MKKLLILLLLFGPIVGIQPPDRCHLIMRSALSTSTQSRTATTTTGLQSTTSTESQLTETTVFTTTTDVNANPTSLTNRTFSTNSMAKTGTTTSSATPQKTVSTPATSAHVKMTTTTETSSTSPMTTTSTATTQTIATSSTSQSTSSSTVTSTASTEAAKTTTTTVTTTPTTTTATATPDEPTLADPTTTTATSTTSTIATTAKSSHGVTTTTKGTSSAKTITAASDLTKTSTGTHTSTTSLKKDSTTTTPTTAASPTRLTHASTEKTPSTQTVVTDSTTTSSPALTTTTIVSTPLPQVPTTTGTFEKETSAKSTTQITQATTTTSIVLDTSISQSPTTASTSKSTTTDITVISTRQDRIPTTSRDITTRTETIPTGHTSSRARLTTKLPTRKVFSATAKTNVHTTPAPTTSFLQDVSDKSGTASTATSSVSTSHIPELTTSSAPTEQTTSYLRTTEKAASPTTDTKATTESSRLDKTSNTGTGTTSFRAFPILSTSKQLHTKIGSTTEKITVGTTRNVISTDRTSTQSEAVTKSSATRETTSVKATAKQTKEASDEKTTTARLGTSETERKLTTVVDIETTSERLTTLIKQTTTEKAETSTVTGSWKTTSNEKASSARIESSTAGTGTGELTVTTHTLSSTVHEDEPGSKTTSTSDKPYDETTRETEKAVFSSTAPTTTSEIDELTTTTSSGKQLTTGTTGLSTTEQTDARVGTTRTAAPIAIIEDTTVTIGLTTAKHSDQTTTVVKHETTTVDGTTDKTMATTNNVRNDETTAYRTTLPIISSQEAKETEDAVMTTAELKAETQKTEASTEKTGSQTTTDKEGSTLAHFEDLSVDEPTTPVPEYCERACPDGWTESHNFCFLIPSLEKSISYTLSISYCQTLSPPRSNLASPYEFQDLENLEVIKQMLSIKRRNIDHFFVNMMASREFRATRQVYIISLEKVNQVDMHVIKTIGSGEQVDNVNALCRTTKFCAPNTCPLKQFIDADKDLVVGLPLHQKELIAGSSIVVPCIEFRTDQKHTIKCQETGEFQLHPSLVTCKRPDDFEDEETDTHLNPLFPENCEKCYREGTKFCSKNPKGPGVLCHCKAGWKMRTCWQSPDMCTKDVCGPNGVCLSLVDHFECICAPGIVGERCETNATMLTVFGANNTDPQETYIAYRLALVAIANFATFLYGHPDFLKVDVVACRVYYWAIAAAYTSGLMFFVNEAANVYQVVRAVHANNWNRDLDGLERRHMRFIARVTVPFFSIMFGILAILTHGWEESTNSYSCFGTFNSTTVAAWFPLLCMNILLGIMAIGFIEGTVLLQKFRPHTTVRLNRFFEVNNPGGREIVGKVERNQNLIPLGVFFHFMSWGSITFANDKDTTYANSWAFVWCTCYALFNLVQLVFTDPEIYGYACTVAIVVLPKRWSPEFEWNTYRNRDEVLARRYKKRLNKEKDQQIREEDEQKAKEREEVEKKNRELLIRWPGLPRQLQYHLVEEGPAISHPRPFPFDASKDDYMTEFERLHLARFWTRSYLETRKFTKGSPTMCTLEVIKVELRRMMLLHKTKNRQQQEWFAMATWWNAVPEMDLKELRAHEKTVIMEDENETDVEAFERAVQKLASIIDLRINRERKGLLKDDEAKEYEDAANFLKYEPRKAIRCIPFQRVDGFGDVVDCDFLKNPEVVLESQVRIIDKAYFKGVKELNEPFDKTYDDDLIYLQYTGTGFKKAAHSRLNVQRSRIGRQRISMNPRKRPLDSFWLDSGRHDFVGPRLEQHVPVGPYEEIARKCEYYQKLTDAQWAQIEHNSYHLENLKKIRKGML